MSLKIIVLVKQVPDTHNITGDAMKEDGTVNRAALPAIFNPDDMHALEAALRIKDERPDTNVTVLTMGPMAAVEVLKEALYRGADEVALISDRGFAGADTLATSYALAQAIRNKVGDFDFVFCGRQAIDGDTAQVGPQTAEKLGVNQVTNVKQIEILEVESRSITLFRSMDGGHERVRCSWPLLLTFTDESYHPRPPSLKRVMSYKDLMPATSDERYDESYMDLQDNAMSSKNVPLWNIENIKANPEFCGLSGSPTKVKHIEWVVLKPRDIKMVDNNDLAISEMVGELISDHTLD